MVDERGRPEAVVHPDDFLLDDRALVEVGRDVVGSCTNQLDAAVVGLVVRARALEPWQERVVDVDGSALEGPAQVIGKHLHVPGQDHEVDPVLVDQLQQALLGLLLGVRGYGDVNERQAGGLGHGPVGFVVGDHQGQIPAQAAATPAEDQIVEAVPELGHHDQNALLGLVVDVELHVEAFRDGAELLFERLQIVVGRSREGRAQVQGLAEAVVELLVLFDVESALEQKRGHCLNDAGTFDTRQCEYELTGFCFSRGCGLRSRPGSCGCVHNGHV